MNEDRLRELLRDPSPGDREAEERGLRVARAAFDGRPVATQRRRPRLVLAVALALVGAALLAVTPAGGAISDFVGDRIGGVEGKQPSLPALTGLPPSAGEILVNSARGPWVVHRDGSRRLLGDYQDASWSPHGLFVVATRGRQLVAMTPSGQVRWSLARPRRVTDPRWSPDGFRIAYRSGSTLRVVNGDGSGDRLLARATAPVAPAWSPAGYHLLAFATRDGQVDAMQTDIQRMVWRSRSTPRKRRELAWTADGRRLAALTSWPAPVSASVQVFAPGGTLIAELALAGRGFPREGVEREPRFLAFAPHGHRLAVVEPGYGGSSDVVLWRADRTGPGPPRRQPKGVKRQLFAGPGDVTSLAWSPAGSWLLIAWRSADQWIFLRPGGKGRVAVSNITRQFDPGGKAEGVFPSVSGWCCPP